jgi:hypothetical protein
MPAGLAKTHQITQLIGPLLANHERIERYRAIATKRATGGRGRTERRTALRASAFHELRRLLEEYAFYPSHPPRKPSPAYRAVHKKLVSQSGCLICGVTTDILKDRARRANLSLNPYGALQLETHHHVIEWALASAIDPEKFYHSILPSLQQQHGTAKYSGPLSARQIADWIDHDEDNLWVLCDVHHRPGSSESMITCPIWGPHHILKDEFIARVQAEIAKRKRAKK